MNKTLFNPRDFLSLAVDLLDNINEGKIRTILNRCYYACFLAVKKEMGKQKSTEFLHHKDAWQKVNKKKGLGAIFAELYGNREVADYSLQKQEKVSTWNGVKHTVKINKNYAEKTIKIAKTFFKILKKVKIR